MKNVLITGANGFVGNHLARELAENGYGVIGIGGQQGTTEQSPDLTSYQVVDLNNASAVDAIDFSAVDGVIHLAGLAAVGPSFDDPMLYINVNIGLEVNLFEAALKQGVTPRFVIISSGALYDATSPLPLTESSGVIPSSPYAVSKLGQEQMAQYYTGRGFDCIIARPFNHIGPGQGPGFIVPDFAEQLIKIEKGEAAAMSVGNLDAERDYTDVRDIARAYRLLFESGKSGEIYNICSGTPRSGHVILDALQQATGIKATVEQDAARMRPADNPVIYGDHSKLTTDTGWQPAISFEQTMADVIADWRSRYINLD
jgi:GDP-4-dehydro-6-deoxy-D-mannose reductase